MLCVTGDPNDVTESVINPFLTEYVELAKIVLLQRAMILRFCERASALADLSEPGQIEQFQREYVIARNQLFLFEVTAQEQGVELFDRLQKELYVPENLQKLEKQLRNLYELSRLQSDQREHEHERNLNWILALLAVSSLITGSLQALFPFWATTGPYPINKWCWLIIIILIPAIGIGVLIKKRKQKRK
jgi:hypothetical protein